jgi:hypothetical protein
MDFSWVLPTLTGLVIGVIGWLLSNKDKQQAKEIADNRSHHDAALLDLKLQSKNDIDILHRMHKEDAAKLEELQREVDREHYRKQELDGKFDKLDNSIQDGFRGVRADMKEMMNLVHEHISEENNRIRDKQ